MKTTLELSDLEARTALADDQGDAEGLSFHDITQDEPATPVSYTLEQEEVLSLLVQHLAELPAATKKILALYYYEGFPRSEIAACFNISEHQVREILSPTIGSLRQCLLESVGRDFDV